MGNLYNLSYLHLYIAIFPPTVLGYSSLQVGYQGITLIHVPGKTVRSQPACLGRSTGPQDGVGGSVAPGLVSTGHGKPAFPTRRPTYIPQAQRIMRRTHFLGTTPPLPLLFISIEESLVTQEKETDLICASKTARKSSSPCSEKAPKNPL